MIAYLDASALVKQYVGERHSDAGRTLIAGADALATADVTGAEVPAALGKAARVALVTRDQAAAALRAFWADRAHLVRLHVTEALVHRAGALAWEQNLRGYGAVHLAAALLWHQALCEPIHLATYDRPLWEAAHANGLTPWPAELA